MDEARALILAAGAGLAVVIGAIALAFAIARMKWKGILRRADRAGRTMGLEPLNDPRIPIGQWYGGEWRGRPFVLTYVNMRTGAGRNSSVVSGLHLAMSVRAGAEIGSVQKRARPRRKSATFDELFRVARPDALPVAPREALQAFAWQFPRADLSVRARVRVPRGWLLPGELEQGRSVLFAQRWGAEVPVERVGEMLDGMSGITGALEEASAAATAGDEVATARRRARVAQLGSVGCPGCGCSLPVIPGEQATTCLFCGTAATLPAEVVAGLDAMPRTAEAIEREGRQAYAEAVADAKLSSPLFVMAFGLVFVCSLCAAVVGTLFAVRGLGTWAGMGADAAWTVAGVLSTVLGIGGFVGLLAGLVGFLGWKRRRTVRGVLARVDHQGEVPADCPRCGVTVRVPSGSASLLCASCGSALLASHGLLIQWVEDAHQRRDEWRIAAGRVLDADAIRDFERTPRAVVAVLALGIVMFTAALALMGLVAILAG